MPIILIKLIIFIIYLILVVLIVAFNLLYLSRVVRGKMFAGLGPPKRIAYLVKASIYIALVTAFFMVILFFFGIH